MVGRTFQRAQRSRYGGTSDAERSGSNHPSPVSISCSWQLSITCESRAWGGRGRFPFASSGRWVLLPRDSGAPGFRRFARAHHSGAKRFPLFSASEGSAPEIAKVVNIYMENIDAFSEALYTPAILKIWRWDMSLELALDQPVQFIIKYEHSTMIDVSTNSPFIDHFLHKVKMCQSVHTWINYAHDLKIFFTTLGQPLGQINRQSCVRFMELQDRAGLSSLTINRRLAAVSSLYTELLLLDPVAFPHNPVAPLQRTRERHIRSQSLYRKQPQRIPDVIAESDLHTFFKTLPSWRDRAIILLMWISCLRISEAVAIRFEDIECSHRSLRISRGKGGHPRVVFMDRHTFAALNKYLDEERGDLFPEVNEIFVGFKGKARGRALSVNAVQHAIDYYAKQCGCSLHAHLFRHTGITQLIEQGMSEPSVRKLVGHKNANSLAPYLHLTDRFIEAEFEKAQTAFHPANWFSSTPTGANT